MRRRFLTFMKQVVVGGAAVWVLLSPGGTGYATDTNTVGELFGTVDVAGAVIVPFVFYVLEEPMFDAIFAAGAAGNEFADFIFDRANGVETGWTLKQILRILASTLAGQLSGAATTTITIRDIGDTKTRVTATVDASGNRSAVTFDAT